nr:hypothetical protein [Tanacetum cinerariifolium]
MALADNELTIGKSHARNDEWVDITVKKVNTLRSMDEDANWQNYLKTHHSSTSPEYPLGSFTKLKGNAIDLLTPLSKRDTRLREDHWTSDHEMYTASLKKSENYKAQPYQYASPSKQILKAKAKPFPPCTHCCFNDHRPDDYRNYLECEIYRSYDHFTLRHNRVIQIRGGVLVESSQSNESSIGVNCDTCGSIIHSTSDHNEFDYFKRDEKI